MTGSTAVAHICMYLDERRWRAFCDSLSTCECFIEEIAGDMMLAAVIDLIVVD